jgi:RNA polymerase sigma-70 factor (ECF subfamily)
VYGRVVNEQSYDELSQILGKSPAVLRKQYLRAKEKLRKLLNNHYEFERGKKNECKQA